MKFLYKFPMFLFLSLEKCSPLIYFSQHLYKNHSLVYITPKWYYTFINIISRDLFFSKNYVAESYLVDTSEYNLLIKSLMSQLYANTKLPIILEYLTIHSLYTKFKLTVLTNHSKNIFIQTNEHFFKNINWLERENSEMFGISYNYKVDSRRLLLDYSKDDAPMLKNFPCSGIQECFYDVFENQIVYLDVVNIEL